jgi:hypothetical protein
MMPTRFLDWGAIVVNAIPFLARDWVVADQP